MNLEQQVKHLDKHYRDGNALLSDKQFDKLEKQLLAINSDSDYFTNRDALPLPSLEKDTIEDFIEGLDKDDKIVLEAKIDGCAVAIEYRDGKIHKAITRKGKDIKDKMIRIRTVPLSIPTKETVQVRGELYTKDVAGNVSQRIAAGYLRSKSFDPNPNLSFAAFQIINNPNLDQEEVILYLKDIGFQTTFYINVKSRLVKPYAKMCKTGQIPIQKWYPIDGIVVKINDYKLQQTRPDYWQMAIKN